MKTLYSPESLKISQWLRSQRELKGLTMRQAGKLLGKPHSFVGKTEIGQRRIDVVEFVWYCRSLGFDALEGISEIIDNLD